MEDNKVAVLLEDLRSQFRIFGEGLQLLNEKFDRGFSDLNGRMNTLDSRMDRLEGRMDNLESSNKLEHAQIIQMIKELDTEVHTNIKRIK